MMLFKKTAKNFLNKEVSSVEESTPHHLKAALSSTLADAIAYPPLKDEEQFIPPSIEPEEIPDVYLGENTTLKGELEFPTLLRIDGAFEGNIRSSGRVVIGPQGRVKANLDLAEAFISGKLEGNITVKERLVLRGRAEIYGNITAPIVSVDEGVTIVGQLCVSTKNNDSTHE